MGQIQNAETLATTDARRDALAIAEAGLGAIDAGAIVRNKMHVSDGKLHIADKVFTVTGRNVYFVGVGKCAIAGGHAIEALLGDALTAGIAFDISAPEKGKATRLETYIGTHPLPTEVNETATRRILEFLSDRSSNDLVIMLISGGGSTLLCLHGGLMTCTDESDLFNELTARGAPIRDINIVRKHISKARGGALAAAAYPAEVVSLIASDVPGNDLATIASGPTVRDTSTVADARAILEKYGVSAITNLELMETPKEYTYFERVTNILFLTNEDALAAMRDAAAKRGYAATIAHDHFVGEAHEIGHTIVERLHVSAAGTALLYAGESTVTLSGKVGAGGRNQEMALAVLDHILPGELVLPFASDGHDNTDHAGAIADETTRAHAREKNLSQSEYLNEHRSYDFFTTTGDALITGYTGSNVSDLIIALKK